MIEAIYTKSQKEIATQTEISCNFVGFKNECFNCPLAGGNINATSSTNCILNMFNNTKGKHKSLILEDNEIPECTKPTIKAIQTTDYSMVIEDNQRVVVPMKTQNILPWIDYDIEKTDDFFTDCKITEKISTHNPKTYDGEKTIFNVNMEVLNILKWFKDNVTGIDNYNITLSVLLSLFAPAGDSLDICVIGDTKTGKTSITTAILKYFGIESYFNGESTRYYDFFGKNTRNLKSFGYLDKYKNSVIVVDETSGMNKSLISKLSFNRNPKNAGFLWLSNPTDNDLSVEAVQKIFTKREDISRIDLVVCPSITETVFPSSSFEFTLSPGYVNPPQFTQSAEKATEYVFDYSDTIPLLLPVDQKDKIRRLSQSLAILTHSSRVTKKHVDFIINFVKSNYDNSPLNFKYYTTKERTNIKESKQIVNAHKETLRINDNLTAKHLPMDVINKLVSNSMLMQRGSGNFKKTSLLTTLLQ